MKAFRTTVAIFVFLVFTFGCLFTSAGEIKIGYINLGKALDEYKKTKESEDSLQKELDKKEQEREKMVNEIKNLKEEIALLSDKGKREKQTVIDEKIKNLQEFDQALRDELRQKRDEALRDILQEIDKIIREYGEKNGYTAILNDRMLLYGDEAIDVTQDIIDILNKNYTKR